MLVVGVVAVVLWSKELAGEILLLVIAGKRSFILVASEEVWEESKPWRQCFKLATRSASKSTL